VSGKRTARHESRIRPRDRPLTVIVEGREIQFQPREAAMSSEIITPDPQPTAGSTFDSERGLLIAVLTMVILGVIGVFLVTA
jgi:hypothetical protein